MADALANIADPGPQPGSAEVFANDALAATQDGTAGAAADAAGATVSPIVADSAADAEERRRHPRAPVDLLVGLKFDTVQQFLAVYAEDISESGMFLRSEHAGAVREVGQVLDLRFDAGQQRIVQGQARVVRVVPPGHSGGPAGIGVEFVDLDPTSRRLVEAIVRIKLATPFGG